MTRRDDVPRQAGRQAGLFEASTPLRWTADTGAAQERLAAFLPYAGDAYAGSRNYDRGPDDRSNVSALSPWISHRVLLESDVLQAALRMHSPRQAQKFIEEVFWRGYFKGWLEHRPAVWERYVNAVVEQVAQLENDADLARRYNQAVSGATGIPCFDSWVRELREWGYLHNHARMWFASVWVMTLRLPWELGADLFLRHLLDGDAASNTCSWRWVSGLHTVGKTYLARPDNIETYTGGRFAAAELAPLLASSAPALTEPPLPPPQLPEVPPARLVGPRTGVLITADDVSVHQLPLLSETASLSDSDKHSDSNSVSKKRPYVVAGLALVNFTPRSVLPSPPLVKDFAEQAVRTGAHAFETALGVPVQLSDATDWAAALAHWVHVNSLDEVVIAHHATGPVKTRLYRAATQAGVTLNSITRDYDQQVWPAARAGYFGLRKKIPSILNALGLAPATGNQA